jgi:hypothetical protein
MLSTHPGAVVMPARRQDRTRNLVFLGTLVLWMAYTRLYFLLHGAHATLPACPFLTLTGHPCPFCGGTRGFAYVWNGDVGHAMQLYPLAPLMFIGTAIAIPVLLYAILAGRGIRIPMPIFRLVMATGLVALAVSWGLKLTILPN